MLILEKHAPFNTPDVVLFDFDGTISKLRSGWEISMRKLFLKYIPGDPEEVSALTDSYIDESTGIPTIRQMSWLARAVAERGNKALEPWEYKQEFAKLLLKDVKERIRSIEDGVFSAAYYLVPGSTSLLKSLKERHIPIIVASGTDEADVCSEADALGLLPYFDEIAGADPYADMCAKEHTIQRLIRPNLKMLIIGDGKVEIRLGREAGMLTLGVASWDDFEGHKNLLNPIKQHRLESAGAHAIVEDFTDFTSILSWV